MFQDIPPADEAELKVMTRNMYKQGGLMNVLQCIYEMEKTMEIILLTVKEIQEEERNGLS